MSCASLRHLASWAGMVCGVFLLCGSVSAQAPEARDAGSVVAIGTPLRVETWSDSVYVGRLQEIGPGHLRLARDHRTSFTLATDSVFRVYAELDRNERRHRRCRSVALAGGVGLLAGGVIGALRPVEKAELCECLADISNELHNSYGRGLRRLQDIAVGIAIGGAVGGGVGALVGSARWREVELPITAEHRDEIN